MESSDLINCAPVPTDSFGVEDTENPPIKDDLGAEPSFEEAVASLTETVNRTPLHREIFLKLLSFCVQQRNLCEVEEAITAYPEFCLVTQSPYGLIRTLVRSGGLCWLELNEEGNPLTLQEKDGLSIDEIGELTFGFAVVTTLVGEQVIDNLSSRKRLKQLFDVMPQRLSTYLEVMDFCCEKRSFKEIEVLLRGRMGNAFTSASSSQALKPSYFVDALERSGGLAWDDGWKITEKGMDVLNELRK